MTGVTLLRAAVATNVDGSGIRVAQPEAALDAPTSFTKWEVNPAEVGRPMSIFTYYSTNGSANVYPNSLGTNSWHAKNVGNDFYGIPGGVATNVAHVDNFEADYFISTYIENASPPAIGDDIINQSFTFGPLTVSQQQQVDSEYDNYAANNGTLFVSAANNLNNNSRVCPPGTSYNCISVGAYANGTYFNSIGPTLDNGRCKPDITAPATDTSDSTPQVAGAAAVLMQAALRGDGGTNTSSASNMLTIKALLLNGAVKPADWTNSSSSPLDARYGAGLLNVFNSYEQLIGGEHGYNEQFFVSSGGVHPPDGTTNTETSLNGWDFNAITTLSHPSDDTVNNYYFNVTNDTQNTPFIATATLVWNRHYNSSYLINPIGINNLNLYLYNCANSNLVMCSTSLVDNVEHLYITNLAQGRYDLQVWKAGGVNIVSTSESYALAWSFVPQPELAVSSGAAPFLAWPVYPAGFGVETTTNLMTTNWLSNLPTPVVTNGENVIWLNPTNVAQFFRLRSPNF